MAQKCIDEKSVAMAAQGSRHVVALFYRMACIMGADFR
jgi:hypothetical protein